MKRLFISLLLLVPVMTFAGCGAGDDSSEIDIPEVPNDPGNDDDDNDNPGTVTPGNGKILLPGSAVGGIRTMRRMWMPRLGQASL